MNNRDQNWMGLLVVLLVASVALNAMLLYEYVGASQTLGTVLLDAKCRGCDSPLSKPVSLRHRAELAAALVGQLRDENQEHEQTVKQLQEQLQRATPEATGVAAGDIDKYPVSVVGETTWDLDHDGTDEGIELYVDAEREQGQLVWDDAQRWLLLVRDGQKTYPLYDEFVPLGVVGFWVFSKEPELVFRVEDGVNLVVYTVKYNASVDEYVVSRVLSAENLMYRAVIH